MKISNLDNIFIVEKFDKLFYRYLIVLFLGMFLLIFLIIIDAIISTAFTDRICVIVAMTNLTLFVPFAFGVFFRILLAPRQPFNPFNSHKIVVTNNLVEISANKSDEMKYTEKDVITIVNGLIKNRNYPSGNNIVSAACYASAINNNDGSSNSLWDNHHNGHTNTSSLSSHSYSYDHSDRRSRNYYYDSHCNPSHPSYRARHST